MTLFVKSRAKLNLSLNVLRTLENNYHDLDMVVCPIGMHDDVIIEKSKNKVQFECTDSKIENENNLAYRAAIKIFEYSKYDKGVKIHLSKRIWTQAGFGGGSSDAAAVLMGINNLCELNLSKSQLAEIAIGLGADVPLFLSNGLTRVQGIGEQVEYYPFDTRLHILAIQGETGLSTTDVFRLYDSNPCRKKIDSMLLIKAVQENDIDEISKNMHNCLQSTAMLLSNPILQSLDYLKRYGAINAMLTGSGSAVYGIFSDKQSAKDAYNKLRSEYKNCIYTTTESEYITLKEI